MCIKINRKVAFLSSTAGRKSLNIVCHPPFHPPIFCRHFLKLLSPTLLKLRNWILLSPPPLSSDPDNPPKFGTCTYPVYWMLIIYGGNDLNPIPHRNKNQISQCWSQGFLNFRPTDYKHFCRIRDCGVGAPPPPPPSPPISSMVQSRKTFSSGVRETSVSRESD